MSETRSIFRSGVANRVDAIWSGARRRRWSLPQLSIAIAAGLMNLTEVRRKAFAPLHDQAKLAVGSAFVTFARGLLLALIVVAGGLAVSRPAAADEAPVAFIRTLGAQALSVIRSDTRHRQVVGCWIAKAQWIARRSSTGVITPPWRRR